MNSSIVRESVLYNFISVLRFDDCSFSFIIPNKSAGSIIGPSGSLINQIRASTQTSIKITKAGKGIHQRCVTVNGEGNNVLQAGKLLMEHLEQSE